MKYRKGERVRHPKKPDWGIGEVLRDSVDDSVKIYFSEVGEKTISLQYILPERVAGAEALNEILEALSISGGTSSGPSTCGNCGQPTTFSVMAVVGRASLGWCPACYRQRQTKHTSEVTGKSIWEDEHSTIDGPKGRYTPK